MTDSITIKLSTDADRQRISELAELDGKRAPNGDVLLAEVQGRLVAAIGMDGTVVADPFERTAAVVGVLRAQIADERRAPRGPGWLRRLLPAG
ncbi:MAG: hypothetical protein QOD71_3531 [Thermoleophilaceae bacterium]|jgi:hypothetical protein|nr:hypothetical protein [Thermoleophilaceae bacterium]